MSWTRTLCMAVLLGVATLPGCADGPGAAPPTRAQAQDAPPAPGGFAVHMHGNVATEFAVGH